MKIAVSYINSYYPLKETLSLIDSSSADFIHVDIMDGKYVLENNFDESIFLLLKNCHKPLDVHLMVKEPEKYLSYFQNLNVDGITIHPSEAQNFNQFKLDLAEAGIKLGIAINPNEKVEDFTEYLAQANKVLIMSVYPGKGGQVFIPDVLEKIEELKDYNLEIGIDGAINEKTVKLIKGVDYLVSGSFVCCSQNFEEQINKLKS